MITRADIDALLRFLPTLGEAGPDTVVVKDDKLAWPMYTSEVSEFFDILSSPPWSGSYDHHRDGGMFNDDAAIQSATLEDIRRMFTFCFRAERFSPGFWGAAIRDGRIGAILRRLDVLRDTVD